MGFYACGKMPVLGYRVKGRYIFVDSGLLLFPCLPFFRLLFPRLAGGRVCGRGLIQGGQGFGFTGKSPPGQRATVEMIVALFAVVVAAVAVQTASVRHGVAAEDQQGG